MAEKNIGNIYTVTKLTREIKHLLEEKFPFIRVTGEISNLAVPASGHAYFTLKDDSAVIQAVLFKNQKRALKFSIENGMKIFGLARLTLYQPRGNYQLIFEYLEPDGAGSAQIAFEQLKAKLLQKGYFDSAHKKKIPFLPSKICLITSGTGAALKDILNVINRRFPNVLIDIIPVQVQGDDSVLQICYAFEKAQTLSKPDTIILARGGGSLEDLAPFNDEAVATSIFNCDIPVITGIGHEIDFTIADFVADLRAPTPSAAAELCIPEKSELVAKIQKLEATLITSLKLCFKAKKERFIDLQARLKSPKLILYNRMMQVEDFRFRLENAVKIKLKKKSQDLQLLEHRLYPLSPSKSIPFFKARVHYLEQSMEQRMIHLIRLQKDRLDQVKSKLDALNPLAILNRGYSVTRHLKNKKVITASNDVQSKDCVQIILAQGQLTATVKKTHNGKEKNI